MEQQKITFIGAGNMGTSIIGGLLADGYNSQNICATDPSLDKLQQLKAEWNIRISQDNQQAVADADIIVFAVKPNIIKNVAQEIHEHIQKTHPLIISIAAGIRTENLAQWLGSNTAIVRCMPNTPALIRTAATALFATSIVTTQQRDQAESLMRAVGITTWLSKEDDMDIVTALSGSGPAYFFLLMESLEHAAIEHGLDKDVARLLTLQTALGATKMAMESNEEPSVLRRNVTSPGGTTEQALNVLFDHDIGKLFNKALKAAHDRSIELADKYS